MDDVDPQNLANLQAVASEYAESVSDVLAKICGELKEGRGSDIPGTGPQPTRTS
jgi:hypothetical protein